MKKLTVTENSLWKYILESILVTFGVVLGLFLSEWNTQRKTDQNTETTLNYIISELEANIPRFENAVRYHEEIGNMFDNVTMQIKGPDLENLYYDNAIFRYHEIPG